jgi:hypothetical protein
MTGPDRVGGVRDAVRDELRKADAKATTLLALMGATLAAVVALTGRSLPVVAVVLVWLSTLPIATAVGLLLSAIRPRLPEPVPGTWLHAATDPAAFLAVCADDADPATVTASDVVVLAGVARTKYQRIRRAVTLLAAGLGVLALALAVTAVAGGVR